MCSGIEIALLGSTLLSAGGATASGFQQHRIANYQTSQADADAEAATAAAKIEADKIRKAGRIQASQANAALAASGVETGQGTALRITSDIVGRAEEDAWTTILNGNHQAGHLHAQARADRLSGQNALYGGFLRGSGSLLKSGAQVYTGWKKGWS